MSEVDGSRRFNRQQGRLSLGNIVGQPTRLKMHNSAYVALHKEIIILDINFFKTYSLLECCSAA